jgi:hypothetical protein
MGMTSRMIREDSAELIRSCLSIPCWSTSSCLGALPATDSPPVDRLYQYSLLSSWPFTNAHLGVYVGSLG